MGEEEIIALRTAKLERLRSRGVDPYPARFRPSHTAQQAVELLGVREESPDPVTVAGRITAMRQMGKATFIDLRDGSGRIQTYVKQDVVGAEAYETLRDIDLVANQDVREAFVTRSRVISALRRFLDGRGFLEVETPVLQASAGGAAARPFVTYHNALDRQLYLRIALELHLKRLIIGGYDRVYEIGRIFRNEGVSAKYNPEFTMLESYQAYADYNDVMDTVEEMVSTVALEVLGGSTAEYGDTKIDFAPGWPRLTLRDAIKRHSGVDFEEHPDVESMREAAASCGVAVNETWGRGKLIDEILSAKVEPHLVQPTFLTDYPVELSPLAQRKPDNPRLVERFELFIAGREVGNAYTELNDPQDQRERMLQQARLRAAGDEGGGLADEEVLTALADGMRPRGGEAAAFSQRRLFPHLRERGPLCPNAPSPSSSSAFSVRSGTANCCTTRRSTS